MGIVVQVRKLKVKKLSQNHAEVQAKYFDVLFSYGVPVACYDAKNHCYCVTEKKYGKITTKHIKQWLQDAYRDAKILPQDWFDNLL